jgi:CBS domain-containing protein
MEIELIEIRDFLAARPPFDGLPAEVLDTLPRQVQIRYLRRSAQFPPADSRDSALYLVRAGAIECRDSAGELTGKLGEGDLYSDACQLVEIGPRGNAKVVEDALLYLIPCDVIKRLGQQHGDFARYLSDSLQERLKQAISETRGNFGTDLASLTLPVSQLLSREPVVISDRHTIRQAAQLMRDEHVSSVLVLEGERITGLLTDRDIRNRCVAEGLDPGSPASQVMSRDPETIRPQTLIIDALNLMSRMRVHHLPVVEQGRAVGMVTATDLTRYQSGNAAYLTADIAKADSVERLAAVSAKLPELQLQLASAGANAQQIGDAISAITDALTQRLLIMAEEELGPAPVPYAWLAGGSQARREQTSHSDQDNALLISDDYDSAQHGKYFEQLAARVTDGLNACGFIYCPGNAMASNPDWRQPLKGWKRHFDGWINKPEPMALMLSSIFFDLRVVHGDQHLFAQLQQHVLPQCKKNNIFIAYMAANALTHRPPLGFFRTFVLVHDGEHDDTLDLKHRGIVPITDIARVLALSAGLPAVNTRERLQQCRDAGALSRDMAGNLLDALEFIAMLRIRHQAEQIRRGQKADNFVPPKQLSELEREYLKDAFKVIRTMQETMETRYQAGRLR